MHGFLFQKKQGSSVPDPLGYTLSLMFGYFFAPALDQHFPLGSVHHCRGDVEAPALVPNAFVNRTSVLWTHYANKILVYLYILVHILYIYIYIYVQNIHQAKICNTACLNTIEYLKVSPQTFAPNAFNHGSIPPFSLHLGTLAMSVNGFSYRSICSLPRIKCRISHFAT